MALIKEGAVNYLTRRGSSVEPGASNTDSLVTVLIQELDNCNGLLEVGLRLDWRHLRSPVLDRFLTLRLSVAVSVWLSTNMTNP